MVESSIIICVLLHVQANRRVLETNEWLRVKGCEDVYAIGDCATIDQRKIMVLKTFTCQKVHAHLALEYFVTEWSCLVIIAKPVF